MHDTINDRYPNFRDHGGTGKMYLVRCFACDSEQGKENTLPAVASGECAHCGWSERVCAECGDHVPAAHTPYGDLGLNCGRGECLTSMLERAEQQRVEIELEGGARMTTCVPVDVAPETMTAIIAVGSAAAQLLDQYAS